MLQILFLVSYEAYTAFEVGIETAFYCSRIYTKEKTILEQITVTELQLQTK